MDKIISSSQDKMELLGKSKEELREFCVALGEPAFRGAQIYHALYSERKFDVAQITNLPAALRERLAKEARVTLGKRSAFPRKQAARWTAIFASRLNSD